MIAANGPVLGYWAFEVERGNKNIKVCSAHHQPRGAAFTAARTHCARPRAALQPVMGRFAAEQEIMHASNKKRSSVLTWTLRRIEVLETLEGPAAHDTNPDHVRERQYVNACPWARATGARPRPLTAGSPCAWPRPPRSGPPQAAPRRHLCVL